MLRFAFKVGIKAAFRDYLYAEYEKFKIAFPNTETREQWNLKFTMGSLKENVMGFVSVAMDVLKTPEMKISIAKAFAVESRLTIIRSEERQILGAIGVLDIEGLAVNGDMEPEISGEEIHDDNDRAFAAYRNPENSYSDHGDVEEGERGEKEGNSSTR